MSADTFFDAYRQAPVSIRGAPGKSPMFFRDFNMMGGVFAADRAAARAALPARGYRSLDLPLGRALVAVHCMEYKDSDIGPYNEVSLSIALRRGPLPFTSLLQAARALRTRTFHAYVKALPVTTEVALHGGVDFFNYPKFLADITFRETSSHRVCTVRDKQSRDLILEFEGRKLPARPCEERLTLHTYPEIKGRPARARLVVNQLERGASFMLGAGLRFGAHPAADVFKRLGIGRLAHYLYAPRCQGVLFAPEAL